MNAHQEYSLDECRALMVAVTSAAWRRPEIEKNLPLALTVAAAAIWLYRGQAPEMAAIEMGRYPETLEVWIEAVGQFDRAFRWAHATDEAVQRELNSDAPSQSK